jgi:restriction endonuclease S subunit
MVVMQIILIQLDKVKASSRMDYDFYDPNQKKIKDNIVKGYTTDILENVCLKINTGKTLARNSYPDDGVRIIKVKNISGNGIKWGVKFFVTEEFYEKAKEKVQVQVGDILMLCSAHNKSYIGRSDIIDTFPQEVIDDNSRCCCVGELIIIRANPEKIPPEYLITFLRLQIVQEQIRRMVKGQSAHLYPKDLVRLDVILPPPHLQQEIAQLNTKAEDDFLRKKQEANNSLDMTRRKIEEIIMSGKRK